MPKIAKHQICKGVYWVEVPEANLYVLCGCPADSVKHLKKRGLIANTERNGVAFETGPNAILVSDILIQNGDFSNLSEFPVLQMLYLQGMILPDHPQNTGLKPLLIGSEEQVKSQMQYIYRGNYGLVSEEEIIDSGISPKKAREMMRLKLKFAFGEIPDTEDLLDYRITGKDSVEIINGVFIRRLRLNVFEFEYEGEKSTVDLNLGHNESYIPSYRLGFHNTKREYFAVLHSGEGDGWDINRPCMASVLMFQGKLYLIDSGPNIAYSLKALGIGVNEIEGVFHTHAHDDHFAGLTTLMHSDNRIKYYASPLVRASVFKKLSALVSIDEENFSNYFEIQDLKIDKWNNINGLEVKPVFSPHPVETTIFVFRTICEDGYRSYAHFADIVSLDVLKGMITENDEEIGISKEFMERIKKKYLVKHDLKKIDVGGGLIHGDAEDFEDDKSKKIILSHTSLELTNQQKAIGSGAPFGMIDVLIPGHQDYMRRYSYNLLKSYFSTTEMDQLDILLNNPIVTFNPESILIRKGEKHKYIYLILTGEVEKIQDEADASNMMSAGGYVGESAGLTRSMSKGTYRAVNYVNTLKIPCSLYIDFVRRNGLYEGIDASRERRKFLENTWLFGENISSLIQNKLSQDMALLSFKAGEEIPLKEKSGLLIIIKGSFQLFIDEDVFEFTYEGDFFNESDVLFKTPSLFRARAIEDSEVYFINSETLVNIPIINWKLFETYKKRLGMLLSPEFSSIPIFQWRDEYCINIDEMDNDHKKIFETIKRFYEIIHNGENKTVLEDEMKAFIQLAESHFIGEEKILKKHNFPEQDLHKKQHERLRKVVLEIQEKLKSDKIEMNFSFMKFFKDWIVGHILTEDRKFGHFLYQKGK
ncbi:MAG: bacteriohemerythrin [Desulfobacterales bacterium]|jgi:hemerythrin|nr:bacteriohemerythrin [Desulfobacteraceae bacterium]MBT4365431.1 bacteriohemerythrin [Desulfobacteraceae bacterium]MBT7084661.1 bacteriohemerythrin [Desulfobacterales bacterium]MBT7697030.1 bacteriohemerythrin [Desulfobacterales bacterium]